MKKILKNIFLFVLIVVFLFSLYKIILYIVQTNTSKELNNKIISEVIIENSIITSNSNNETKIKLPFKIDFQKLNNMNTDIKGWIYLENSPINYPILQSTDNDYYLHNGVDKKNNVAGSIFLDYENNGDFSDKNIIIYGHNMKNDTMFGTLQDYRRQDYFNNHNKMYLMSPTKNYSIEIFAGFTISSDNSIYSLTENNINQEQIAQYMKNSDFNSDVIVDENDKIIILSTCSYDYKDARYVVMGKMIEIV